MLFAVKSRWPARYSATPGGRWETDEPAGLLIPQPVCVISPATMMMIRTFNIASAFFLSR
jgi:hypothetical protein